MDYVAKVNDLLEASKSISTLPSMVELDIQKGTVRVAGSHTRNLLRVKRGIDMVKVLFEQILVTEDAASKAYTQVFAPHHGWGIRKAVGAGITGWPPRCMGMRPGLASLGSGSPVAHHPNHKVEQASVSVHPDPGVQQEARP